MASIKVKVEGSFARDAWVMLPGQQMVVTAVEQITEGPAKGVVFLWLQEGKPDGR